MSIAKFNLHIKKIITNLKEWTNIGTNTFASHLSSIKVYNVIHSIRHPPLGIVFTTHL